MQYKWLKFIKRHGCFEMRQFIQYIFEYSLLQSIPPILANLLEIGNRYIACAT